MKVFRSIFIMFYIVTTCVTLAIHENFEESKFNKTSKEEKNTQIIQDKELQNRIYIRKKDKGEKEKDLITSTTLRRENL